MTHIKRSTAKILDHLVDRYHILSVCKKDLKKSLLILLECHKKGNKIMICGNGGSASDSEHISGELLKGFMNKRGCSEEDVGNSEVLGYEKDKFLSALQKGIKAIPLPSLMSAFTAYVNDMDPDLVYAQLLYALGDKNDVLITISTSGNSKNTYYASLLAKALNIKVISLTGEDGGKLRDLSDVCIKVPETETYKVQELHLPVYHCLCAALEEEVFG